MASDDPKQEPTMQGLLDSAKAMLVSFLAKVNLLDLVIKVIPSLAPVAAARGNDHNDPRP